jgi:polysaccharide pyruvyl transferase WcaK-like protein
MVWGGYGFGNAGDELLLAAALRRELARGARRVAVLSREPEVTRWNLGHGDVVGYEPVQPPSWHRLARRARPAMPSYRLGDQHARSPWMNALRDSARLRLTGGGYVTDLFDLDYFLMPAEAALNLGIEVEIGPVGVGPFRSSEAERRAMDVLRECRRVTVRDDISLELLGRHGIAAEWERDSGFEITALPGFEDLPARPPRSGPPRIGVLVSPQHGAPRASERRDWMRELFSAVREQAPDAVIEGFSFQAAWWEDFREQVAMFEQLGWDRRAVRPPMVDWKRTLLQVRDFDLVFTTRFHPSVVAHAFGVPYASLLAGPYYERKMVGAFRDLKTRGVRLKPLEEDAGEAARRALSLLA